MKTIIRLTYIFLCLSFWACKDAENSGHDPAINMELSRFIPLEGDEGTEMMIFGNNFSLDTTQIAVYVNGAKARITGANMERILLIVPPGGGTGSVEVRIGDQTVKSDASFKYPPVYRWRLETFAGSGSAGFQDGLGRSAQFNFVRAPGLAVDRDGNVYIADVGNHCIRKITPEGQVSTVAGTLGIAGYADGNAANAKFDTPFHVSVDKDKNLYVSDTWNAKLRKITPTGEVSTLTGVGDIVCTAIDPRNNTVYAASLTGGAIYQVLDNGNLNAVVSGLDWVGGITIDAQGWLYIVETGRSVIRRMDLKAFNGSPMETTIIAGIAGVTGYEDGAGSTAKFDRPWGIASHPSSGELYIAGDSGPYGGSWYGGNHSNQCIRLIKPRTWDVSTFFGTAEFGFLDGLQTEARLNNPTGVAVGPDGSVYIVDANNQCIRKAKREEVL